MAMRGLEVVDMKRRRANLWKLGEAIRQLQSVLDGLSHCEKLVDSGQLEIAIYNITCVEQLASGTLHPEVRAELHWLPSDPFIKLTDLCRLHAFVGLSQGINRLRMRIQEAYCGQFIDVLLYDVRRHVSSVPPKDILACWTKAARRTRGEADASSSTPTYIANVENLRDELGPVLQGLCQSQYLATASTMFREAVIREMKSLIRQHLPSSANDDDADDDNESVTSASTRGSSRRLTRQELSVLLSRKLRALSPRDAEAFFVKVYCGIGEALRRLGVQVKVLLDITSFMKKAPSNVLTPVHSVSTGWSVREEMTQALHMSSLLEQAVDKAQSETTKLLRVRAEQTVRLGITDFLSYFGLNRLFVDECEAISGHPGAAFKSVLSKQIHDFVPLMHKAETEKLAQKMESERWGRGDFKPEDAVILARIILSMTDDPPAWHMYVDDSAAGPQASERDLRVDDSLAQPASAAEQAKRDGVLAVIGQEKFTLVDSAIFALRGIEQYIILLVSVPSMTKDISTAMLEYLGLYNSRTQELILGARAKVTAGLANINTKHLALASQSLSFFIALIPYLRECVRRRQSITGSSTAGYDRLKRLFQDHQSSIHDKLVDIMRLRASVGIKAMEKIEWDDEDEVQRNVSPHVETLVKEALTLHEVLSKYLPELTVRMIIGRVFEYYMEKWSKVFEHVVIWSKAGQARLLRDAELLKEKLSKIDDAEMFGAHMVRIVNEKQITS